jgi:hypothetical protein
LPLLNEILGKAHGFVAIRASYFIEATVFFIRILFFALIVKVVFERTEVLIDCIDLSMTSLRLSSQTEKMPYHPAGQ